VGAHLWFYNGTYVIKDGLMGIIHNFAIFTNDPNEGGLITEKGNFWIE